MNKDLRIPRIPLAKRGTIIPLNFDVSPKGGEIFLSKLILHRFLFHSVFYCFSAVTLDALRPFAPGDHQTPAFRTDLFQRPGVSREFTLRIIAAAVKRSSLLRASDQQFSSAFRAIYPGFHLE